MANDFSIQLSEVLLRLNKGTIAVSGGVDSMTLSSFANRVLGPNRVRMVHAISPAVPLAATIRVRDFASREGWQLTEVDAGEFRDPQYRSNPINRCFFCKSNLYGALRQITKGVIMSGTNCDDLDDYRPGLKAAKKNSVLHPYVEAGMAKDDIRKLASILGLDTLADLPASPCLSSRIETGIRIEQEWLSFIDEVEEWMRASLSPTVVRCRIRNSGVTLEIDPETLKSLDTKSRAHIVNKVRDRMPKKKQMDITFASYRRGSAFVDSSLTPTA